MDQTNESQTCFAKKACSFWGRVDRRSPTFIVAVGVLLLLLLLSVTALAMPKTADGPSYWYGVLLVILGSAIGGAVGSLLSPTEPGETAMFKVVATIAAALITGFVWQNFAEPIKLFIMHDLPTNALVQVRTVSFTAALFLAAFVMYAYRSYSTSTDNVAIRKSIADARAALKKVEKTLSENVNDGETDAQAEL